MRSSYRTYVRIAIGIANKFGPNCVGTHGWPVRPTVLFASTYRRSMALSLEQVVICAVDSVTLGSWWSEVLGWTVVNDDPREFEISSGVEGRPTIIFELVDEAKREPNRLHLDLRPDDQAAELERLTALGATPLDIGQGDVSWIVLGDPEGNEFCLLSSRRAAS